MRTRPLVIAHRGASGYRPEHTLASYRLAIEMGADYVEPDLCSTRDGVLVCRHENEIGGTTDVALHPEFAHRRGTRTVGGQPVTGWFTEDFTLAELKTLRATERLPGLRPANTRFDGHFEVPTFDELLALCEVESSRKGTVIGVYPETKHPSHFASLGLDLEPPLLAALAARHLDRPNSPVFIQSFEVGNLQRLKQFTQVPLVQLVDWRAGPFDQPGRTYEQLLTKVGLREISTYAAAVGVAKNLVIGRDESGELTRPTSLVADAHDAGLAVHAWTLRDENEFLPLSLRRGHHPADRGDASGEYARFAAAGVDGIFTDFPDTAAAALSTTTPRVVRPVSAVQVAV